MEGSTFNKHQNCQSYQPLTIPFPDESIIANLDNIISVFSNKSDRKVLSQNDLLKTLEDLKLVKVALKNINFETMDSKELSSDDQEVSNVESSNSGSDEASDEVLSKNDIVRNSIDMLKNGGKFTKVVKKTKSFEKSSGNNSSRRNSKDSAQYSQLPTRSSLLNLMTVSSCPLSRRKSPPNNKRITRRISRQFLLKKADKTKVEEKQKQPQTEHCKSPKITGTHYATCRIHHYEDNSHTFEIINPNRVNCFGDGNEKSEIVIVVLANGQMALFTSKSSKSFKDILSFNESQ